MSSVDSPLAWAGRRWTGWSARGSFGAQPGCERIPILALTAGVFAEGREQCRTAGMDDFIPKPVAPKELYATLNREIERHAHSDLYGPAT